MTWNKLPIEIKQEILNQQKLQQGYIDENIFISSIGAGRSGGGFTWEESEQGEDFWYEILEDNNIDKFYELYPKVIVKKEFRKEFRKIFNTNRIPTELTSEISEKLKELNLTHILL